MVIEVLYVPGCPNHQPAVEKLRNVLRSAAIDAPIQEIEVANDAMARQLKFPGSPTIRVEGSDVESNPQDSYGLACNVRHLSRLWWQHARDAGGQQPECSFDGRERSPQFMAYETETNSSFIFRMACRSLRSAAATRDIQPGRCP